MLVDFNLDVFRLVFNNEKEDVLGKHDSPVRCVEYSNATGWFSF